MSSSRVYVELTPGTYSVGATLNAKPAIVIGDHATIRVVDAAGGLNVDGQGTLSIRHVEVLVGPSAPPGIGCKGNSVLTVTDVRMMGGQLFSDGCPKLTVSQSTFTGGDLNFNDEGIVDATVVVDRSTFVGASISVSFTAFAATITNNLIIDENGVGLSLLSLANGVPTVATHVENNTIVTGAIQCNDASPASPSVPPRHFANNIIVIPGNKLPAKALCTYDYNLVMPADFTLGGLGNIFVDPKFVDAANRDYHLQPGSPAINAGDPTSLDDHDLDNHPRPLGGRVDIGAYESN